MPERPPHGRDEIPDGYEVVAVPEGPQWRIDPGRRCRRVRCPELSAASVRRGIMAVWWAYCKDHMYGRWIEDDHVMHWILREKDGTDA